MKRQLTLFFLLLTGSISYSQFDYYKPEESGSNHRSGEFMISASPDVLFYTPNGVQLAGGIKVQIFLGKRFSLDADLVFGRDYAHFGPGLIGIPIAILAFSPTLGGEGLSFDDAGESLTEFLFSVAAIALSFEHLSYHIPLKNNLDIAPYVSLLRYKYSYEYGKYSEPGFIGEQLCFASGVQINKYFGRFVLAPYAEYNIGYRDQISGISVGCYCGIYFPSKQK
jgi:hypothetical protein